MAWNEGYVTDVNYTHGYYPELNPVRARYLLLQAGFAVPTFGTACELGFGQGMSIVMHGAAQPKTEWWGTDFNPAHAAFAQELSGDPARAARLPDQSFEQFCRRSDLPDFDFIGLHGIWTWVSHENHGIIVDFIRRKLKVGGILYISYNTYPGWADLAPLRHLLKRHVEVMGARGSDLFGRIGAGLDFLDRVVETDPFYVKAAPRAVERLKQLREHNRNYIAHEYLTHDWHTMYFAELAKWLEPAKLSFASSAGPLDQVESLNFNPKQRELLASVHDPEFRESLRDFLLNQQFRRDYWIKGPRSLSAGEKLRQQRRQRVVLGLHRPSVSLKVRGGLGEAEMQPGIYNPILDFLADHQVRTVGEIEAAVAPAGVNIAQVLSAVNVLVGTGAVHPAETEERSRQARESARTLNRTITEQAAHASEVQYLASPVTGGGLMVGRFEQMFLQALRAGKKTPADWAAAVWSEFAALGQRVLKDGKTLETAEENVAELTRQAESFAAERLPVLRALEVI
ncbi:methyltransferase regulatory domain-containing protein [Phenylobacterium sp.]|jgi:SAM-dependent methyltransferase|uniref:methyltransferase regulatory domain-containing protein n=1 Tax=Phenylobacterium sp. TaxID=1871053 RepID=UPI002F938DA6